MDLFNFNFLFMVSILTFNIWSFVPTLSNQMVEIFILRQSNGIRLLVHLAINVLIILLSFQMYVNGNISYNNYFFIYNVGRFTLVMAICNLIIISVYTIIFKKNSKKENTV